MLREVNEAFRSANITNCELFYSGGIRRGTDVLKALAYGAKGVFLDVESVFWALAHEQTTTNMMSMINEELRLCMVLTHSLCVKDVTERQVIHWIDTRFHEQRAKL